MKEGTAADVATLGLMKQFDTQVMIKGYQFLQKLTPAAVSKERFPEYGHFYGCMGMLLLQQEFKADKAFRDNTSAYIAAAQKDLMGWQSPDGSWPLRGWVASAGETNGFATAFTTLVLWVPEARLSIYNRNPPKLPKAESAK
jgi:hypothetical protein